MKLNKEEQYCNEKIDDNKSLKKEIEDLKHDLAQSITR